MESREARVPHRTLGVLGVLGVLCGKHLSRRPQHQPETRAFARLAAHVDCPAVALRPGPLSTTGRGRARARSCSRWWMRRARRWRPARHGSMPTPVSLHLDRDPVAAGPRHDPYGQRPAAPASPLPHCRTGSRRCPAGSVRPARRTGSAGSAASTRTEARSPWRSSPARASASTIAACRTDRGRRPALQLGPQLLHDRLRPVDVALERADELLDIRISGDELAVEILALAACRSSRSARRAGC